MPFPAQDHQPYTEANLATLLPRQPAVYGIFNADRCIFISQTDDLRGTMFSHVRGESDMAITIDSYQPTHWLAGIVPVSKLDALEAKLVAEYHPICNP